MVVRFTCIDLYHEALMPRYAAVDIGSNSIRLLVADCVLSNGLPRIARIAEDRQVVRLGSTVFKSGSVEAPVMDEVCAVLRRFQDTWRKHEVLGVRAVATSATRDASNQAEFVTRAADALGASIETISGQEEARLIHLGVQTVWPQPKQQVLMVDVGGGSAELIASESGVYRDGYSRPLGAVRLTEVFLKKDPPTEKQVRELEEYIEEKLALPLQRLGGRRYDRVIATSASAAAVVCAANRIARTNREAADRMKATVSQVRKLYRELVTRSVAERRKVAGIGPRRAEIIVPGAAVFWKVLERFGLESMHYSMAGVRDGIIADLTLRGVGRANIRLSGEQRRAVEALARKFGVATRHAKKVAEHALNLFEALSPLHSLAPSFGKLLEAASYLRDAGHYVSDTGHHKHSHYLIRNSDLAGFTDAERSFVALLCRYHRKTMPTARHLEFQALDAEQRRALVMLTPLLRLADALDRSREQHVQGIEVEMDGEAIRMRLQSHRDVSLEQWAAEANAEIFRSVYGRNLMLTVGR